MATVKRSNIRQELAMLRGTFIMLAHDTIACTTEILLLLRKVLEVGWRRHQQRRFRMMSGLAGWVGQQAIWQQRPNTLTREKCFRCLFACT